MVTKVLFFCLVLLSAFEATATNSVTVLVFHTDYYDNAQPAIQDYKNTLSLNHHVVSIYSNMVAIDILRANISKELDNLNIKFKDVTGINLFGPVISTTLHKKLKQNRKNQSVSSLLRYDNLKLVFQQNNDVVVDINTDSTPYPARWVSHQHFQDVNEFSAKLNDARDALMEATSSDALTEGAQNVKEIHSAISAARTIPYTRWFDGPIWGAITPAAIYVAWYISGKSREAEGNSSGFNRFETPGDIPGNAFLYTAYFGGLVYSAYSVGRFIFSKPYKDNDWNWKIIALSPPLHKDGLLSISQKENQQ